ncbi:MAG: mechanosensitive ion channel family protein [Verrucomicrobiia bacterium]|jgi:MscS family membrane protein
MKIKFEHLFRVYIGLMILILLFAVWADAQTTLTNTPNVATNVTLTTKPTNQTNIDYTLTFGLDQIEAFKADFLGRPIFQYIASLVYIILAYLAMLAIDFVFIKILKRLTAKTETKYDDLLVDLLRKPTKVIVIVIFLHIGLNVFDWPDWIEVYLSKGLKIVVAWSITIMAMHSIDVLMQFIKDKSSEPDKAFDMQLYSVLRKGLKIIIGIVAALVTAQNLGINITGLLASLSIGGLAIGLAAQDTLANLFGAVAIFLDRPFHVGERITIDSYDGVVEKIGLRSTQVRNLDGHLISIPNKTISQATIVNISRRPNIRTVTNIGIIYETPPEKIKRATQILEEVYRAHPKTKDVLIGFNKFNDFSLNIMVVHWWDGLDYKEYLLGMQELNLNIVKRFNQEGIEFAYPTQVHYVKQPESK